MLAARRAGDRRSEVEPATIERVRIRRLDGASTWKYLD
jgi:hypothetical protein